MPRATKRNQRPKLRLVRSPRPEAGSKNDSSCAQPVREEKVALARRRMAEGYYDRVDVLERVAEGILLQLRPSAPSRTY